MRKPIICIGENKGADQLRSNCEADQRLCFLYTDSTIALLSKSKISSLYPSSVTVQPSLCRTWSESKLLVFSRTVSNDRPPKPLRDNVATCMRMHVATNQPGSKPVSGFDIACNHKTWNEETIYEWTEALLICFKNKWAFQRHFYVYTSDTTSLRHDGAYNL